MSQVQVNPDGSGFAKSSFSMQASACVETVVDLSRFRDSKNVAGPVLSVGNTAGGALVTFARSLDQ